MRSIDWLRIVALFFAGAWSADTSDFAFGAEKSFEPAAVLATDGSADAAIQFFRAQGRTGLQTLLDWRQSIGEGSRNLPQFDAAIEKVSGQRYGAVSRLYWYTDLNQAMEVADREHKPILSLRLLGKLTDEYSCANSRFFRTTLYANPRVSQLLRDNFILHWESVRPAPVATIDFGDGRVLRRTVTGNSIHYALLPDGRLIDGLPGLVDAATFIEWLNTTARFTQHAIATNQVPASNAAQSRLVSSTQFLPPAFFQQFHKLQLVRLMDAWRYEMEQVAIDGKDPVDAANEVLAQEENNRSQGRAPGTPRARAAAGLAVTKMVVEVKLVAALDNARKVSEQLEAKSTDRVWQALARLHEKNVIWDETCRNLISSEQPLGIGNATSRCKSKSAALASLFENLQRSIALDTVRNEYLMHRKIHEWLASAESPPSLQEFNARVYDELFLTPANDPWLGLVPTAEYSGLGGNGILVSK